MRPLLKTGLRISLRSPQNLRGDLYVSGNVRLSVVDHIDSAEVRIGWVSVLQTRASSQKKSGILIANNALPDRTTRKRSSRPSSLCKREI